MSLLTAMKEKTVSKRRKDDAGGHYVGDVLSDTAILGSSKMFGLPYSTIAEVNYTVLGNTLLRYAIEHKEKELGIE